MKRPAMPRDPYSAALLDYMFGGRKACESLEHDLKLRRMPATTVHEFFHFDPVSHSVLGVSHLV